MNTLFGVAQVKRGKCRTLGGTPGFQSCPCHLPVLSLPQASGLSLRLLRCKVGLAVVSDSQDSMMQCTGQGHSAQVAVVSLGEEAEGRAEHAESTLRWAPSGSLGCEPEMLRVLDTETLM